MTLTVSSIGKDEFFGKLLNSPEYAQYQALVGKGVKFASELFTIKASYGLKNWQVNLPVVVTTLLKADLPAQGELAKKMINEFIDKLHQVVVGSTGQTDVGSGKVEPTAEKSDAEVGVSLGELLKKKLNKMSDEKAIGEEKIGSAAEFFKKAEEQKPKVDPKPKVAPKAKVAGVSGVIPLIEAQTVLQKVRGTSSGSVYYTIAVNPRVKLAARIKGSAISLRAEVVGATSLEQKAINASMQWHGSYGSTHFEAGSVPVSRVLGAVIYGMGIKFDDVLKAGEEVPNGV